LAGALVVGADVGQRLGGGGGGVEGDDLDAGLGGLGDDRAQPRVVQGGDGDAVHLLGDQVLDDLDLQGQLELLGIDLVDGDAVLGGGGLEALVAGLVVGVDALGHHHEGLLGGEAGDREDAGQRQTGQAGQTNLHGSS